MRRDSGWLPLGDRATFVHLHLPDEGPRETGVILVPGLGMDYFHGYRALRFLADSLADAGLAVLRMDFTGCGHSIDNLTGTGPEAEPAASASRTAVWTDDVLQHSLWLRRQPGIERLCFIANRAGGLMLQDAIQADDDLVIWGGVASGRSWLRELKALEQLGRVASGNEGLESGGLSLDPDTCAPLEARILATGRRLRRILLVERGDRPLGAGVQSALLENAERVDCLLDADYPQCFREPHLVSRPDGVVRTILNWIGNVHTGTESQRLSATSTVMEPLAHSVSTAGWSESVLRIDGLFGILTQPSGADRIVLLGNAGAVHAAGPNRLSVDLARQLAGEGIATLRYDLSNLGDSVCAGLSDSATPVDDNHPYPATAERDVATVMQWARQAGYRKIILAGLCSGAYAAFDFARARHASKPDEVLLINPLTFQWRVGMSLEIPDAWRTTAKDRHYQAAAGDRDRWIRLLTGRIDYPGLLRHLAQSLFGHARKVLRATGRLLHVLPPPVLADDLFRIAACGTRMRFFFASNEPGLDMLAEAGRSCLDALDRVHMISIDLIARADHTFRQKERRLELMNSIVRNLADEHRT